MKSFKEYVNEVSITGLIDVVLKLSKNSGANDKEHKEQMNSLKLSLKDLKKRAKEAKGEDSKWAKKAIKQAEDMLAKQINEALSSGDKKLVAKLEKMKTVKTKSQTSTAWYSPNTEYEIDSVTDGYYNQDKAGIQAKPSKYDKGGFIPLKDLDV
jgi:uncharacterized membrane-anchored protein YjiN (DUF445 family)